MHAFEVDREQYLKLNNSKIISWKRSLPVFLENYFRMHFNISSFI